MMFAVTLQQTPFDLFSCENYVIYNTRFKVDVIESRFYMVQRLNTLLLQLVTNVENFFFELFSGKKANVVTRIPNTAFNWAAGLCLENRCVCYTENYQLQNGTCVPTQTVQAQIEDARAELLRSQEASGSHA